MLFSLKAHHHTHHTSGWSFILIRWPPKRAEFQLTILVNECRHMFLEATPVPSFSLSRPPSCWAVFLCMAHRQDEALCTASTCIGNLKSDNLQIGKVMGKKHMSHLIMWRHVGSRVNRRLMEQWISCSFCDPKFFPLPITQSCFCLNMFHHHCVSRMSMQQGRATSCCIMHQYPVMRRPAS